MVGRAGYKPAYNQFTVDLRSSPFLSLLKHWWNVRVPPPPEILDAIETTTLSSPTPHVSHVYARAMAFNLH